MNTIQYHKESGIRIENTSDGRRQYRQPLAQARQDADFGQIEMPSDEILRIFKLSDGRLAVVHETQAGLQQEAASPAAQAFFAVLQAQATDLIAAEERRKQQEDISDQADT